LNEVIRKFRQENPDLFQIIRLEKNLGIGGAANKGLNYCKNDLVAKMDADDIARNDRCEKQLHIFNTNSSIDIVGSHIIEFREDISNENSRRIVPLKHSEILKYAKRRMPFNNQTVMYRKNKVLQAGGYSSLKRCEDYDLYSRMLMQGCHAQNIDDCLVWYRLTDDAFQRRGTWENFKGFVSVRWKMHKRGFSSLLDFVIPCCGQVVLLIITKNMKDIFYKKFLR